MSGGLSDDRDARAKGKNRVALIAITAICLALAACGFAFARWLLSQPHIPSATH